MARSRIARETPSLPSKHENGEYLRNGCAELDRPRIPRKGPMEERYDQKSEGTTARMREIRPQDQSLGHHHVPK